MLFSKKTKVILKIDFYARVVFVFFLLAFIFTFANILNFYLVEKNMNKVASDIEAEVNKINEVLSKVKDQEDVNNHKKIKESIPKLIKLFKIKEKNAIEKLKQIRNNYSQIVKINSIKYSIAGDKIEIYLSGFAKDRDSLIRFKKELKQDKLFSNVELPIESLLKDINTPFTIKLNISLEKDKNTNVNNLD